MNGKTDKTGNNLAIIPARGGSKRIPGKNIKSFFGKPIIVYSVETALKSELFDEVMVSTDDKKIVDLALQYGAKVPFIRSEENSNDQATITDVLIEVIHQYETNGHIFDNVCCILPTAPLISNNRITEAYCKLINEKLDFVCPVVAFSYPIFRALEITKENKLQLIWPEYQSVRSQDLKTVYHDAGSFIWVKKTAILYEKTLFCRNGGAIILSEMEVQDIDSETDWNLAELKYKFLYG